MTKYILKTYNDSTKNTRRSKTNTTVPAPKPTLACVGYNKIADATLPYIHCYELHAYMKTRLFRYTYALEVAFSNFYSTPFNHI